MLDEKKELQLWGENAVCKTIPVMFPSALEQCWWWRWWWSTQQMQNGSFNKYKNALSIPLLLPSTLQNSALMMVMTVVMAMIMVGGWWWLWLIGGLWFCVCLCLCLCVGCAACGEDRMHCMRNEPTLCNIVQSSRCCSAAALNVRGCMKNGQI